MDGPDGGKMGLSEPRPHLEVWAGRRTGLGGHQRLQTVALLAGLPHHLHVEPVQVAGHLGLPLLPIGNLLRELVHGALHHLAPVVDGLGGDVGVIVPGLAHHLVRGVQGRRALLLQPMPRALQGLHQGLEGT